MNVSTAEIKELRERTGAGMMDCKKALIESGGDLEKAVEYLREKGLAAAAKKAGRIAAEGMITSFITPDKKCGALVEVNCETDFVTKVDSFREFARELAEHIAVNAPKALSAETGKEGPYLLEQTLKSGATVQETVNELVANIGEKITVRRFVRFERSGAGLVQDYIHMGGKIGVLLEVALENAEAAGEEAFLNLAKDLAMQVAAAKPEYVRRDEVDKETLEKERAIYMAQAVNEGKPEAIAEKIAQGRLEKFFKEACLEEQVYIKDNNLTVKKLLEEVAKKLGAGIEVVRFARYEKGEGLAKRSDDFVGEVMSQLNQ
ncbi:MAG TPA: elongation factor Ts [Firmicutes bacterium]|jgi:elongation factor Ts|nr:elongation factor Ts [Bacillota bacterium]